MRPFITYTIILGMTASYAVAKAPDTPAEPVAETLHGVEIVDPYRWLEGSDAPEIEGEQSQLDEKVAHWTEAQNAHTRQTLDGLEGRQVLEDRLGELLEVGTIQPPQLAGGHYFYTERRGDQSQAVLYVRDSVDGSPRALIDPNTLDSSGLTSLGWFQPSQDGKLVAFGLFKSGDENTTLYVLKTEDGSWLAEEIPGKVNSVSWMPEGDAFVYRRLADPDNPYSGQLKFHRVGTHHRQDRLIFEQYKEGPLATTWGPNGGVDRSGRWFGMVYFTGTESNDLWVYDFKHWLATGELKRTDLIVGERAMSFGTIEGNTFYIQTTLDASNGQIFAVDLERPERKNWRTVVPQRDDAVIEGFSIFQDTLTVRYLDKASNRIEMLGLDGKPKGSLDLPGIGTANLRTFPETSEAFLSFQSYNEPYSIYRVDLKSGERRLWARPEIPVDPSQLVVEQVSYPSKDGTDVTMFVVHRKGLKKNGKNPTILYGYGGFSISMTPSFSATMFPWMEQGGVYAVANLRGGGEYGEAWHQSGMLEKKQNVFDDFIAAGEYLIREGYTNSQQLGIYGGSNGGLLTGAALVQRPDLFSAVISAVPLLDMLRYHHFLMARYWVPEYGSSEDSEQLQFLLQYSPYQNVRQGEKYPAVLLTAGENDTRVHPLHARKMAARLQSATSNDPEKEPILLWVEGEAGHGRGKPLSIRKRDAADVIGFMAWQLGLKVN